MNGQVGHPLLEKTLRKTVPNWAGYNLCSGVRWRVKSRGRQPIKKAAAFIPVPKWSLLVLRSGFHPPGLLPLSQSPTQETRALSLPPPWGIQKNTSHQQGLDEAIVELADVAIQVPRLCESALTPAAGMGLLPCVDHSMPA